MVMTLRLGDAEADRNDVEERRTACGNGLRGEIVADVKCHLIGADAQGPATEQGRIRAPVSVGERLYQQACGAAAEFLQGHSDACRRSAGHGVEYMSGEAPLGLRLAGAVD